MSCIKHSDAKVKSIIAENQISSSALNRTAFPQGRLKGYRYVRIGLSSPIQFSLFEFKNGKPTLSKERVVGENLHMGEGGMLILTNHPVSDEGFILLTLTLNESLICEQVLGKIKKVEALGKEEFLVGVELVSGEELNKLSCVEQREHLPVGSKVKPPIA